MLFVIVSIYKPIVHHMDVKTNFLIGELEKKKIYIYIYIHIIWSNPRVVLSLDNNIKFVNWLNSYMD